MRPGVAARLGADYKSVSRYNPGIVVCSVTGFGASGPWANKKAYDVLIQATAGTCVLSELDRGLLLTAQEQVRYPHKDAQKVKRVDTALSTP